MSGYTAEIRVWDTRPEDERNKSDVRKVPVEVRMPTATGALKAAWHNIAQWSPDSRALVREVHVHPVGDPQPPTRAAAEAEDIETARESSDVEGSE